eukprot:1920135-Amphidinium_carterae.1
MRSHTHLDFPSKRGNISAAYGIIFITDCVPTDERVLLFGTRSMNHWAPKPMRSRPQFRRCGVGAKLMRKKLRKE